MDGGVRRLGSGHYPSETAGFSGVYWTTFQLGENPRWAEICLGANLENAGSAVNERERTRTAPSANRPRPRGGRGSRSSLDGAQGDPACRIYGSQRRRVFPSACQDLKSTAEHASAEP